MTNAGPASATSTTVTDTLPAGVTFDADGSSSDCTAGPPLTCAVDPLLPGESAEITIAGTLAIDFEGPMSNVAAVQGAENDPDPRQQRVGGHLRGSLRRRRDRHHQDDRCRARAAGRTTCVS